MLKISRSKIELFTECQRCFWMDVQNGIKRPPPAPYTINNAIDYLLKQEFDVHRAKGTAHPVMEENKIRAVPFQHENMNKWRHNFTGVQYYYEPADVLLFGAVDDVWVDSEGNLIVVDYKATGANQHQIYDSYRRQMEIYQWLVRQNGFPVSKTGYFLFAKVNKANGFGLSPNEAALGFSLHLEAMEGDDSWVEAAIKNAKKTYSLKNPPESNPGCNYCTYVSESQKVLKG